MSENNTVDWTVGVKFVQFRKFRCGNKAVTLCNLIWHQKKINLYQKQLNLYQKQINLYQKQLNLYQTTQHLPNNLTSTKRLNLYQKQLNL